MDSNGREWEVARLGATVKRNPKGVGEDREGEGKSLSEVSRVGNGLNSVLRRETCWYWVGSRAPR